MAPSPGKFEIRRDEKTRTLSIRMEGYFDVTSMQAFADSYKAETDAFKGRQHLVLADMRGMLLSGVDASKIFGEAIGYARTRKQFGKPLADLQAVQALLADSAVELEASRLLVHKAAAVKDAGAERITYEAAVAKLFATEAAQRIIDRAVQIHGGNGVVHGAVVERLYRDVRALRIYEGASEIQREIIARRMFRAAEHREPLNA